VRFLVVALVAAVLGCERKPEPATVRTPELVQDRTWADRYFDHRTAAVFAGSDKVEVFRVDATQAQIRGEGKISGYPVIGRGPTQGPEFAAKLARILADPETYSDYFKFCDFDPGVAFRVWKGDSRIDLIICFECNKFSIGPPTQEMVGETSDFTFSGRSRFLRLAKEALPNDKVIQGLRK
jgi:hypothetical protein